MNSIPVTPALRKAINAAVRANTSGFAPCAEVGLRDCSPNGDGANLPNALNWTDDSDLGDFVALRAIKAIDAHAAAPGCAELDLYVTSTYMGERQLETNVCVLIRDGAVLGATSESHLIAKLKAHFGFPVGNGF
jgi:hypothetical protein